MNPLTCIVVVNLRWKAAHRSEMVKDYAGNIADRPLHPLTQEEQKKTSRANCERPVLRRLANLIAREICRCYSFGARAVLLALGS